MQPERPIILGLLLLALARLVLAPSFDLLPEEAFWATAADRLAPAFPLGGPVPAVMALLGQAVFGPTEFGVRLPVVLLGLASAWCFYRLVRSAIDGGTAAWAVLALSVCPFVHLASTTCTAAGIAMHFSMIGAYLLWLALLGIQERASWLGAGFCLGLALLSHPLALLPAAGAGAALLGVRRWRARWRQTGPWTLLAAAGVLVLPVLAWLLFAEKGRPVATALLEEFREHRGGIDPGELAGRGIEALIGFSPLLLAGALSAGVVCLRRYLDARDYGSLFFSLLALPSVLAGLAFAIEARAGVVWLAPGFVFGIALLAEQWSSRLGVHPVWIWLRTLALILGALLCAAASCPDLLRSIGMPMDQGVELPHRSRDTEALEFRDPSLSARGWDPGGRHLDEILRSAAEGLGGADNDLLLLAGNWKTAAELDFYLPRSAPAHVPGSRFPRIHPVARSSRPGPYAAWSSYAAFPGTDSPFLGRNALLVLDTGRTAKVPSSVTDAFRTVEMLSSTIAHRGPSAVRRYVVYRCLGYRGEKL